jgi:hypothetical protein
MDPRKASVFFHHLMNMKMSPFNVLILFIIIIKLLFGIFTLIHFYYFLTGKSKSDSDKNILFCRERLEFVFIILMSILLIYTFYPRVSNSQQPIVDAESKLLLSILGFVLLLSADWSIFIHESPIYKKVQKKNTKNKKLK